MPTPKNISPVPEVTVWMPCAPGEQPRPAPPILTTEETIQLLRLDVWGNKNPKRTLDAYRAQGLLVGMKCGRGFVYPLNNVLQFINRKARQA